MPGWTRTVAAAELRRPAIAAALGGVLLLVAPSGLPAWAQSTIIIYHCTDTQGQLTVQNGTPCPRGSRQDAREMEVAAPPPPRPWVAPPPPPSPTAQAASDAPPAEGEEPPAPPPQPPTLYLCTRVDSEVYFSESETPPSYCARLQTVGIGGNQGIGAGEACEVIVDTCTEVPAEAQCRSWRQRVREAEAAWRFAPPETARDLEREHARLAGVYAASSCAAE